MDKIEFEFFNGGKIMSMRKNGFWVKDVRMEEDFSKSSHEVKRELEEALVDLRYKEEELTKQLTIVRKSQKEVKTLFKALEKAERKYL